MALKHEIYVGVSVDGTLVFGFLTPVLSFKRAKTALGKWNIGSSLSFSDLCRSLTNDRDTESKCLWYFGSIKRW